MTAPSDGAGTAAPPSARSLLSRRTHIQPGDTILLELPTKLVKVVKLSLDSRNIVQLGKYGTFDADAELVGKPYGVTYEIVPASGSTSRGGESSGETAEGAAGTGAEAGDTAEVVGADAADGAADGKMSGASKRKQKREAAKEKTRSAKGKGKGVAVTNSTSKQLDSLRPLEGLSLDDIEVTEATNEKILAQGAKTLDPAKILELKAQGVSGAEIIAMQIAAHEQFELKNEYSKAKYTKRKEAKFLKFITPLPPTVHNLCQYYFNDDPRRIRELRPDTLAQMLALANVRQGSRVLVVDDASGLVTAAVAERVAGEGLILVLHPHDSPPPNQSLPMLNLPESYITPPVLRSIHWGHTNEDWQSSTLPVEPDGEDAESERQKSRLNRRKRTQDTLQESVQEFRDGDFDACIISSIYEPVSILKRILPALGGSAQIVVQSPVLQVLADLSKTLIFDRSYLNPTILEPFLRQYQVLPGRTHPTMNGTAHGGYILHAIRIYDTEGASSARATGLVQDRPNKKKRR